MTKLFLAILALALTSCADPWTNEQMQDAEDGLEILRSAKPRSTILQEYETLQDYGIVLVMGNNNQFINVVIFRKGSLEEKMFDITNIEACGNDCLGIKTIKNNVSEAGLMLLAHMYDYFLNRERGFQVPYIHNTW